MNYTEFRKMVRKWPIISTRDIMLSSRGGQAMRNQLERWKRKGLLTMLRRGMFLMNENDRVIDPSRTYIANQLYNPSYVSLEYALGYYGLIPDRVSDVTSITTKKTMRYSNAAGVFTYQHVMPKAFRAFTAQKDEEGLSFLMAEPEKALADYCYLHLALFQKKIRGVFEESIRLQNVDSLRTKKVIEYAAFFENKKLLNVCKTLCVLIKEEGGR